MASHGSHVRPRFQKRGEARLNLGPIVFRRPTPMGAFGVIEGPGFIGDEYGMRAQLFMLTCAR